MRISSLFNRIPGDRKLIKAVKAHDPGAVNKFLARGANANASDPDGSSVLILAAYGNNPDMVQALIDHGADIHKKNKYGTSARMYAKMGGYTAVVDIIDKALAAQPQTSTLKPSKNTP